MEGLMNTVLCVCVGLVLLASFVWAVSKNFLTTKVRRLDEPEELHVVVTGGSKGIGKAIAKRAAIEGSHVTILARSRGPLEATAAELRVIADGNALERGRGQRVLALPVDVCDEAKVAAALGEAEANVAPVDVLVCNVGGSSQAPFEELAIGDFEAAMRVNFLSAVYSIRAVVGGMKARRRGRVVLMSSQAGQIGLFGYTAYSAAKFALRGFAEALQMELTPYDVRVTVAFPPNTDTDGFAKELEEMPEETRNISETAGTWSPDVVASQIWEDVLEGTHYSTMGLDGWMLGRGTAGMSPETDPARVVQSVFLSGVLRLVSLGYLRHFDAVVERCRAGREKKE